MRHSLCVTLATMLLASPALAQTSPDQLILGDWRCTVSGEDIITGAKIHFDPNGSLRMVFAGADQGVTMTFTIDGPWKYESGQFSQSFNSARIDNIVVQGTSLAREDFPGGTPAIAKIEEEFLAQHANSKFSYNVQPNKLTLVDTDGVEIACGR